MVVLMAKASLASEAIRDGAPAIDLVDGDQLADKLKELGLGITTEIVEEISIDADWYKTL